MLTQKPAISLDLHLHDGSAAGVLAEFDATIWTPLDAKSAGRIDLQCATFFPARYDLSPGPHTLTGVLGAHQVRASGVWVRSWDLPFTNGRKHARGVLVLDEIYELTMTHIKPGGEPSSRYQTQYALTECPSIAPATLNESSYDGSTKVSVLSTTELHHPTLGRISFQRQFHTEKVEDGYDVRTSRLVAVFDDAHELSSDADPVLAELSKVLALVSLGARKQVRVCNRLSYNSAESSTTYYQFMTSHEQKVRESHDPLFEKAVYQEYLNCAVKGYFSLDADKQVKVVQAAQVLTNSLGTIEEQFVAVFATLEGVISEFATTGSKDAAKLRRAHSKKVADVVRKALEEMKKIEPWLDVDAAVRKAASFNAPSAKQYLADFLVAYSVDLSDLWPMHRHPGERGTGLYEIRSRLAHGNHFKGAQLGSLHFALIHLRLVLERVLLTVLGVKISGSACASDCPHVRFKAMPEELNSHRMALAGRT